MRTSCQGRGSPGDGYLDHFEFLMEVNLAGRQYKCKLLCFLLCLTAFKHFDLKGDDEVVIVLQLHTVLDVVYYLACFCFYLDKWTRIFGSLSLT